MDIKIPKNFFGEEIELTVFISEEQLKKKETFKCYGKYFEDTGIFNVFPEQLAYRGDYLGEVYADEESITDDGFCGVLTGDGIDFYFNHKKAKTESYSLYQSIFSRNEGILETNVMTEKKVVILGCGSVGSLIAMELARSGVGNFLLVDADTLEYHNLCRHQCGIEDVGDLKVNALKYKLLNINPNVNVLTFDGIFQNIPKQMLDDFCVANETVFIGCADNRTADVYANRISIFYDAAFVSVGFWERAFAGEIFYHIPNQNMPCYECALGDGGNVSGRVEANHHVYSNQEDLEKVRFEPGISVDISFITSIGIKIIIDILNMNTENYIPRLLNNLKQYTLVCNTNNTKIAGEMVEIFSYPLQVTTSLVVGFDKNCNGQCKYELEEK